MTCPLASQTAEELNREGYYKHVDHQYGEAALLFKKAIQAKPGLSKAHYNLSCTNSLILQNENELSYEAQDKLLFEAMDELEISVRQNPEYQQKSLNDPDLEYLRNFLYFYEKIHLGEAEYYNIAYEASNSILMKNILQKITEWTIGYFRTNELALFDYVETEGHMYFYANNQVIYKSHNDSSYILGFYYYYPGWINATREYGSLSKDIIFNSTVIVNLVKNYTLPIEVINLSGSTESTIVNFKVYHNGIFSSEEAPTEFLSEIWYSEDLKEAIKRRAAANKASIPEEDSTDIVKNTMVQFHKLIEKQSNSGNDYLKTVQYISQLITSNHLLESRNEDLLSLLHNAGIYGVLKYYEYSKEDYLSILDIKGFENRQQNLLFLTNIDWYPEEKTKMENVLNIINYWGNGGNRGVYTDVSSLELRLSFQNENYTLEINNPNVSKNGKTSYRISNNYSLKWENNLWNLYLSEFPGSEEYVKCELQKNGDLVIVDFDNQTIKPEDNSLSYMGELRHEIFEYSALVEGRLPVNVFAPNHPFYNSKTSKYDGILK